MTLYLTATTSEGNLAVASDGRAGDRRKKEIVSDEVSKLHPIAGNILFTGAGYAQIFDRLRDSATEFIGQRTGSQNFSRIISSYHKKCMDYELRAINAFLKSVEMTLNRQK